VVDGLTLKEIGERFGVIAERVRQVLAAYAGLRGKPPGAKRRGGA
jgi:DNA-directed RNA polymerase sigma subunit (sigma70/sigma32)